MKKFVVLLAVAALAAGGCSKKEEAAKPAPQGAMPGQAPAGAPGDPHAGLKPVEVPAGAGHKGKVVSSMNAAGYTYVEVEENGQKVWLAVMETTVKPGDMVEYPDVPPIMNFQSKSLKKTFDKIFFVPGVRIVK